MAALQRQGFAGTVFGIDLEGKSDAEIKKEYAAKYARAQAAHRADRVLNDGSVGERGRGWCASDTWRLVSDAQLASAAVAMVNGLAR